MKNRPISYHYLEETYSTNTYCMKNIDKFENLSVIYTHNQTHGRGQKNNQWYSTSQKSLCFSIIIKEPFIKKTPQNIIKLMSQTIIQTFSNLIDGLYIKPPNDIYINDAKIAGILCETHIIGQDINALVLGIGININQLSEDINNWQLPYPATSLLLESVDKEPFIINEVLHTLIYHFVHKL